jgi:hypothetical protein
MNMDTDMDRDIDRDMDTDMDRDIGMDTDMNMDTDMDMDIYTDMDMDTDTGDGHGHLNLVSPLFHCITTPRPPAQYRSHTARCSLVPCSGYMLKTIPLVGIIQKSCISCEK